MSVGFNVDKALTHTARIDNELEDLKLLVDSGARISLLSHHESESDLSFLIGYLADHLRTKVTYLETSDLPLARRRSFAIPPGHVQLLPNTRTFPGETAFDDSLADAFASLGDKAVIAGFSRAHRQHSSNFGLIGRLRSFAGRSCLREISFLDGWADPSQMNVAVLGGLKYEKVQAFLHLAGRCGLLIPGGAVLNAVLQTLGVAIGSSAIPFRYDQNLVRAALVSSSNIYIPRRVVVTDARGKTSVQESLADVPIGSAIVDFLPDPSLLAHLRALGRTNALFAGPPSHVSQGHMQATRTLNEALLDKRLLVLGGHTDAATFGGFRSTGGGSALQLLAGN